MIKSNYKTMIFLVALAISPLVYADRPSITSLQQQINQLQADLNSQQDTIEKLTSLHDRIAFADLVDSNGNLVGDRILYNGEYPIALFNAAGVIYAVPTTENGINIVFEDHGIVYDQLDCLGVGYVNKENFRDNFFYDVIVISAIKDGIGFVASDDQSGQTGQEPYLSAFSNNTCRNLENPGTINNNVYAPAVPVLNLPSYVSPFYLKLHQ